MRKTFPLELLEELGLTGDSPAARRRRATMTAPPTEEAGDAFDRLSKSLQPSADDLDSEW